MSDLYLEASMRRKRRIEALFARVMGHLAVGATILGGIFGLIYFGEKISEERHNREIQNVQASLESGREENAKLRKDLETARSQLAKEQEQARSLRSSLRSSIQELEKDRDKLQQMVEENAKLRKDLETARSQLAKEQEQARSLRSSIQELEKDRDKLQRDERPPLLQVTIDDSEAPARFMVRLKNSSQSHIRLLQRQLQSWVNGRPGKTTPTDEIFTLAPGITSSFLNFNVRGDLKPIQEGKEDYRAGFCIVYEAVSDIDRRRWLTEHWFKYEPGCPNDDCIVFLKQDDRILKSPSDSCNLKRLIPRRWLDIKK
jgi:regulator of replication initiation timing